MIAVIGFHSARSRFVAFVKMDTDENGIASAICERGTIGQRNITITDSRHQRSDTLGLQQPINALRDIQSKIFLHDSTAHPAGILPPMARIENHQSEWPAGSSLWRRRCLGRSRIQLPPDK